MNKQRSEVLTRIFKVEPSELPDTAKDLAVFILAAHNKGQKRRLKKQLQRIIDSL